MCALAVYALACAQTTRADAGCCPAISDQSEITSGTESGCYKPVLEGRHVCGSRDRLSSRDRPSKAPRRTSANKIALPRRDHTFLGTQEQLLPGLQVDHAPSRGCAANWLCNSGDARRHGR